MLRSKQFYLSASLLLIGSLACAVPAVFIPDANAISTSAAQTVVAGLTQNIPFSPTVEFTPTITFTSEPPAASATLTETATPTLTPTQISTAILEIPIISVSIPTNCRNGPGKVYVMVGALLVGQTAQIFGRDPTNNYWYIRNPNLSPEFCWVWGAYATLTGPVLLLPIFTPPPTPTPTLTPTPAPAFSAQYSSFDLCNTNWWIEVKLKNTGPIQFKSIDIAVEDKDTNVRLENLADGFTNIDGCLKTTTKDKLDSGDTYLLSAPAFAYDLTGHKLHIIITLCSETGQKGLCITNKIDYKP